MRVQGYKIEEGWATYGFDTTYRMSWTGCLSYVRVLYEFTDHPEVLVGEIAGVKAKPVEINGAEDIWDIPEKEYIVIRGRNKIYDGAPFSFTFFNQTSQVHMEMPEEYLSSLKKSETEFLDDEGKKHTFDKFMDSIELAGDARAHMRIHANDVKAVVTAISEFYDFKEEEGSDIVYRNKTTGTEVNISEICKKVIGNCKKSGMS